MSSNPDPSKQAVDVCFSNKCDKVNYPPMHFNSANIQVVDDTFNPMCLCSKEPETTLHYLSRCDFYSIYRLELLKDICDLNHCLKNILEENLLKVLLYGAEEFSFKINSETLNCRINFIKKQFALVAHYFVLIFFSL